MSSGRVAAEVLQGAQELLNSSSTDKYRFKFSSPSSSSSSSHQPFLVMEYLAPETTTGAALQQANSASRDGEEINLIVARNPSVDNSSLRSSSHNHYHQLASGESVLHWSSSKGLSQVYQPRTFEEIVGHEMIVKALGKAIRMRRVSPLYLFHGPGGTGKTTAAKIFGMALNCDSASPPRPCWACAGCSRSLFTAELRSGNRNSGFEKIRTMLESTAFVKAISVPTVFILEECHCLSADSWAELFAMEEKVQGSLVFIMITEDVSVIPRAASSRCQRFSFQKLKETDIARKLARIVAQEGIDIQIEALQLIAKKAEGNLREAENLLDQLALMGQTITPPLVQQLVGLVPQDQLIHLMEAALSGGSVEAVRCIRDLIASGINAQSLVSQLVLFVTEILAGASSFLSTASNDERSICRHLLLKKTQPEKLCHILEVLIGTEKQMMAASCNQTTLVTAAMLQIASDNSSERHPMIISMPENRHPEGEKSNRASEIELTGEINQASTSHNQIHSSEDRGHPSNTISVAQSNSGGDPSTSFKKINVEEVWHSMLERIHSTSLREFLQCQAKLVSLTVSRANAIVHLMFKHSKDKPAAEMSTESISASLEAALGCPVTVNISREPADIEVESHFRRNEKKVAERSHSGQQKAPVLAVSKRSGSLNCRGTSLRGSASQAAGSPTMESVSTSTRRQDSTQMSVYRGESMMKAFKNSKNGRKLHHSGYLARRSVDSSSSLVNTMNHTSRSQPFDTTFVARATELKQRLLSISSIPQTDASVEPYSQDLLFEEANSERHQGTRNYKLSKDSLKSKQHSYSTANMGLSHSWSCTERFCRSDTTVRENAIESPTSKLALKWVFPSKVLTALQTSSKKAQLDLRKTVPTSSSSSSV